MAESKGNFPWGDKKESWEPSTPSESSPKEPKSKPVKEKE